MFSHHAAGAATIKRLLFFMNNNTGTLRIIHSGNTLLTPAFFRIALSL